MTDLTEIARETWRTHPKLTLYRISDEGRVIGPKGFVLSPTLNSSGYPALSITEDGKRKSKRVHVMVLETFVGPRPHGAVACHNDGDRQNNRLGNLRWGTPEENTLDMIKHGRTRAPFRPSILSESDVLQIKKEYVPHSKTHNGLVLAKKYGVSRSAIYGILEGTKWAYLNNAQENER